MAEARASGLRIEYDDRGQRRAGAALSDRAGARAGSAGRRSPTIDARAPARAELRLARPRRLGSPSPGDFGVEEMVEDALAVIEASGARDASCRARPRTRAGSRSSCGGASASACPALVHADWMLAVPSARYMEVIRQLDSEEWPVARDTLFGIWAAGVDTPEIRQVLGVMAEHGEEMWRRSGREIEASYARGGSPLEAFAALDPPVPVLHALRPAARSRTTSTLQRRFAAEHDWFSVLKLEATTHFAMIEAAPEVADAIEALRRPGVRGSALRVSIVGGGIGGLTAAVALARKGIDVEVFEQAPGPGRAGASIDLGPNAVRLLDALGLATACDASASGPTPSSCCAGTTARRSCARRTARPAEEHFGAPLLDFYRPDLHDVLLRALPDGRGPLRRSVSTRVEQDDAARRPRRSTTGRARSRRTPSSRPTGSARRFGSSSSAPTSRCSRARSCTAGSRRGTPSRSCTRTASTATGSGRTGTRSRTGSPPGDLLAVNAAIRDADWARESWTDEAPPEEVLPAFAGWHEPLLERFRRCRALPARRGLREAAARALVLRPGHAARRRRPRHGAVPGAGRGAGDRGRVRPRRVPRRCSRARTSPGRSRGTRGSRMRRAEDMQDSSRAAADTLYLPDGTISASATSATAPSSTRIPWGHRQPIWEHDVRASSPSAATAVFALEPVELVAHDLHRDGRARVAGVDAEQRDERLELLAARAVLDRPADVAAQPVSTPPWTTSAATTTRLRSRSERTSSGQAPPVARDRLLGEPLAEPLATGGPRPPRVGCRTATRRRRGRARPVGSPTAPSRDEL